MVPVCTDVCNALIGKFGMHVFTGCDPISAFAGQGMMTALRQMKSDKTYQEAALNLDVHEKYLKSSLKNWK